MWDEVVHRETMAFHIESSRKDFGITCKVDLGVS